MSQQITASQSCCTEVVNIFMDMMHVDHTWSISYKDNFQNVNTSYYSKDVIH